MGLEFYGWHNEIGLALLGWLRRCVGSKLRRVWRSEELWLPNRGTDEVDQVGSELEIPSHTQLRVLLEKKNYLRKSAGSQSRIWEFFSS